MTTELDIARHDTGAIMPAAPVAGTTAAALEMLRGHAEMMSAAHQLATAMVGTAMVPAPYRGKPDDAAAAILYGAELGLNPIQSLQQVFPVHGQPSIYARTMVALLKARGFRFRTIESTDTSVTVEGTSPTGETEASTWTIERADRAGYTNNKKYETDPQAMLYAKACAEVCRKLAPDVLLGISHTREDLELEPVRVESVRVQPAQQWKPVAEILTEEEPAEAPKVQQWQAPETEAEPEPASEPAEKSTPAPKSAAPAESPTQDQITALGAALREYGVRTRKAQLYWLSEHLGRTIADPIELTADECTSNTEWLKVQIAEAIAYNSGQQTLDAEGDAK